MTSFNMTPREALDAQVRRGSQAAAGASFAMSMMLGASLGGIMGVGGGLAAAHIASAVFEDKRRKEHRARALRLYEMDQEAADKARAERRAARAKERRTRAKRGVVLDSSSEESDDDPDVDGFDSGKCVAKAAAVVAVLLGVQPLTRVPMLVPVPVPVKVRGSGAGAAWVGCGRAAHEATRRHRRAGFTASRPPASLPQPCR